MYPCHIGLLMSLPEGAETLQNNVAQLCELWYVKIMTNAIDSIPWLSYYMGLSTDEPVSEHHHSLQDLNQ